jgi:rubrerythrin
VHITANELRHLARDVDDMHHDAMRDFKEESAELHLRVARNGRRSFLRKAGVATAGGALLGISPGFAPVRGLLGLATAQELDDMTIAGYAQGVELAAVEAYRAAGAVLSADVKPVGELFASHHQQHADAFGEVAGDKAATGPNQKLLDALGPQLDAITDQAGALELAFVLENQAAYTYAAALTLLQDPTYAAATSTILPIEAQHAVVLGLALGRSPAEVFPTGAFESAELGDGTDPNAGLDPATFA